MMLLRTELEKLWKRPALWIGFTVSLLVGGFLTWSMLPMVYRGGHDFRPEGGCI